MRVLSIDPAVRNTGYAVLEGEPRKPAVLAFDVISIPKNIPQSAALSAIRTHLVNIIQKFQPDEVAVEGIIYVQSHQTAISMGAARAAALIAAADHGLRVYEYAPRKVKSAVVGNGNADVGVGDGGDDDDCAMERRRGGAWHYGATARWRDDAYCDR